jgi:hypothetical protein
MCFIKKLFLLGLLLASSHAGAVNYYVSPSGRDNASGLAPDRAWKSLARVAKQRFKSGDGVYFQGGGSFDGKLSFDPKNAQSGLTLGSYGEGRARFYSNNSTAILIHNLGDITIQDLELVGAGIDYNQGSGINFYNDLSGDVILKNIRVQRVRASGYREAGVVLGAWKNNSSYENINFNNIIASRNGKAGILTYAYRPYLLKNVVITYCVAYDNYGIKNYTANHSGSGIVLGGASIGEISYSLAYNNGIDCYTQAGPVGIWAYDSEYIIIKHNESYNNKTSGGADGDGFDLDQNSRYCVLEFNYSHDNYGAGFLLCQSLDNLNHTGNIIRYNISQNDARRKNLYGGILVYGKVLNTKIYHNSIYIRPTGISGIYPRAIVIANWGATHLDVSNLFIRNNIFITQGGVALVEVSSGQPTGPTTTLFQRNCYYTSGGAFKIVWKGSVKTSIAGMQAASASQEKIDGVSVALVCDPGVISAGGGGTLGNVSLLGTLDAYRLRADSPLIDAGVPLDNGGWDFYQQCAPQGLGLDIGACEWSVIN